jgi:hypothetical protein
MKHTVEIGHRPVAIINAPFARAKEWSTGEKFQEDLKTLRDASGRPLLNGEQPVVRASTEEEIAKWDAARTAGNADEEDKAGYFAFLVPVRDPSNRPAENKLRPVLS